MKRDGKNRQLYDELVRSYARDLYRFAFRLCGRVETAEDLVQEAFCEAWRSIDSLREPTRGKAWLFGILRHRNSHQVRDSKRRIRLSSNTEQLESLTSCASEDVLLRIANQELLQNALNALDDRYKEPLLFVYMDGATCREAAERLEIPLGTLLSRIHRGRLQIREYLLEHEPDASISQASDAGGAS